MALVGVIVVLVVIAAAVVYSSLSGPTHKQGNTMLASLFALTDLSVAPVAAVTGIPCAGPPPSQCYAYSFDVTKADGGTAWNEIALSVVGPGTSGQVPTGNGSHTGVAGYAACPSVGARAVATQDIAFAVGNVEVGWSPGNGSGSTKIATSQVLVVYVAGSISDSDPLQGDRLSAVAIGSISGTFESPLP